MHIMNAVSFHNVNITNGFWADKQELNNKVINKAVKDRFEDTGRFEAFNFNWTENSNYHKPHFFWDSDVAKWLEGACNIYSKTYDKELLKQIEDVIDKIEKNQCDDGYFNIYHTVVEPELKFKDRDHHELYCLGHLIEAAVAYNEATHNKKFINIVDKYIDLVIKEFVTEKTAAFSTPGHEEIELALIKLYKNTGDKKYLTLAKFFIDNRGLKIENEYDWANQSYNQSHLPVRKQKTAEGHCVRAVYLYSGMVDVARETEDEELYEASKNLFDDIVNKKMYITGGIGSSHYGEAFTIPYDMPNDVAYNETCASIGLAFFADRMKDLCLDSKYADIFEKEIYNGILSGVSLDGKAFFYENPLEINISDRTRNASVYDGERLPITQRQEVFGCSCCPPNITRFISSIGGSIYSYDDDNIYVHQFIASEADINGISIKTDTNYPCSGKIHISVKNGNNKNIYIRKPGWCSEYHVSSEYSLINGYICIAIKDNIFELDLEYIMYPQFYLSSSKIRADYNKAALMYGPVVYCMEKVDNKKNLFNIEIDTGYVPEIHFDKYFNLNVLSAKGFIVNEETVTDLYFIKKHISKESIDVHFIPYNSFANRGESDMAVWFYYK